MRRRLPGWSLKPSLVEWKHEFTDVTDPTKKYLETFLGGMETERLQEPAYLLVVLETFLGGMETMPIYTAAARSIALETFLGGMETAQRASRKGSPHRLETFLGGMETPPRNADPLRK